MRLMLVPALLCLATACGQNPNRPTQDTAKRMLAERCPAGYVEYPAGSGFCEPYQRPRETPVRDTLGGVMSQPMPMPSGLGGLRR